jgi:protoporphyrinogen oxidase
MYAARRSGLKQEKFGHVHGGYASILGRVQQYLDRTGVETLCRADVEIVTNNKDGVHVQTRAGGTREFDRVILTLPSGDIPRLCFQLSPSEKQRLQDVTYQGVLCASLILRKSLAGNYITNIADQRAPFAAVIEMTALVDRANFDSNSLVYLPRYQSQDDPYWTKKDDEIREEWVSYLQTIYPQCQKEDVVSFNLTKASHVLPVTTLDYSSKLLPPVRTSLKNVYVVNSAQIPNGTMNGNEIVGLANRRAKEIAELLST